MYFVSENASFMLSLAYMKSHLSEKIQDMMTDVLKYQPEVCVCQSIQQKENYLMHLRSESPSLVS